MCAVHVLEVALREVSAAEFVTCLYVNGVRALHLNTSADGPGEATTGLAQTGAILGSPCVTGFTAYIKEDIDLNLNVEVITSGQGHSEEISAPCDLPIWYLMKKTHCSLTLK